MNKIILFVALLFVLLNDIFNVIPDFLGRATKSEAHAIIVPPIVNNGTSPSFVQVTLPNSTNYVYLPPPQQSNINNFSIGQLVITFNAVINSSNASGWTYNKNAWGVVFFTPGNFNTQKYFTGFDSSAINISIDDSGANFAQMGQQTGVVKITFDFSNSNPQNQLLPAIANLLGTITDPNNANISTWGLGIMPYYDGGNNATIGPTGLNSFQLNQFYWQQDIGAIANPPIISSIVVQEETLVLSLSPPTNTSPIVYVSTGGQTQQVQSSLSSTVTNYVVMYWDDALCSRYGTWLFDYNFALFSQTGLLASDSPFNTEISCNYTTFATTLGCDTTPSGALLGQSPNNVAIPFAIPTAPGLSNQLSTGCYNTILVSSLDRSSVVIDNLINNHTYGFTVWVTDSSSDSFAPNGHLSMQSSAIVYATPVEVPLASTDASLPASRRITTKSTADCFVVTAAAGDIESPAVVYWRILRDKYLDSLGITPIYHKYAKRTAVWLENHPELKPYFNTFFEVTGRALFKTSLFFTKLNRWGKEKFSEITAGCESCLQKAGEILSSLWEQKVFAEEQAEEEHPFPNWDVVIQGGVFRPSTDAAVFNKYYHSEIFVGYGGLHYLLPTEYLLFFVGPGVTYFHGNGISENKGNTFNIQMFSFGVRGTLGVKARLSRYVLPWAFVSGGVDKFREEPRANASTPSSDDVPATSSAVATTVSPSFISPLGVSLIKPMVAVKGGLEVNLTNIFYKKNYDYSPKDILLKLSYGYNWDLSRKGILLDGYLFEAGFDFLL